MFDNDYCEFSKERAAKYKYAVKNIEDIWDNDLEDGVILNWDMSLLIS